MKKKYVKRLSPGLYEIYWKKGGASLAEVGKDEFGHVWFWQAGSAFVPSLDWKRVSVVEQIELLTDHQVKHRLLHRMLDELIADFVFHTHRVPGYTSIIHLLQWSESEIKIPSESEEVK